MSSSVFPAVPEPKKVDVANDRLLDLMLDLQEVKVMAEQAKTAADEGRFDEALKYLEAAKQCAEMVPPRRKWAELAVTAAKEEAEGKGG